MPMAYVVVSTPVPSIFPTPRDSLPQRDFSTLRGSLLRRGPYGEDVAIEKLQSELSKQRQLTEVLRYEVGQQELEKQKARYAATPTHEVGGSVLETVQTSGSTCLTYVFRCPSRWSGRSLRYNPQVVVYTTQHNVGAISAVVYLCKVCGCNRVCATDTLRRRRAIFIS